MALPAGAGDFASEVRRAMRDTRALLAEVGGANSDELRAAGTVLARSIRKQFRDTPEVSGTQGVRRVKGRGIDRVVSRSRVSRHQPSAPGETPAIQTARTRRSVGQAVVDGVRRVGVAAFEGRLLETGDKHSAARPFMEKALTAVEGEMTEVVVSTLQRKGA